MIIKIQIKKSILKTEGFSQNEKVILIISFFLIILRLNFKKVSFIDERESKNLCEYKPPTVINEDWDFFELEISECKTLEDMARIKTKLKEEYIQIEQNKRQSKNVSEQLEIFQSKLDLVEQVSFELEQNFALDKKIETEKELHKKHQLAIDTLFDNLVNCAIDLLIFFDFQLSISPYDIIDSVKKFLDSVSYRKIRVALLWPNDTNYFLIDFFDKKTETENFFSEKIDNNFSEIFQKLKWNRNSFKSFLIFHIWDLNENFLSNFGNKENQLLSRVNISDIFGKFYAEKLNKDCLSSFLEEIRMKKLVYDLFSLKRNNISKKFTKQLDFKENIKFSIVEDLNSNFRPQSKINLKIDFLQSIRSNKIFLAERKKKFYVFSQKELMWLECFPKMNTNKHFHNIYTKTLNFVNHFNSLYNHVKVSVCKTIFLFDQMSKLHWLCNKVENDSQKKEINTDFFKNDICQAFMHFCYIHSNTKFIIFDLGPKFINENCVLFTEPVIQTKCFDTKNFSTANLGTNGIEFFFENKHNCNILCKNFI